MKPRPLFVFPKWSNAAALGVLTAMLLLPAYVGALLAWGANPVTLNVGYQPLQPVPYSHAQHVGKLGLDCRYCHTTVEGAAFAALPPTEVCMNCHKSLFAGDKSVKLKPVRDSFKSGLPVPWMEVHRLPDYVYFNHSAHVNVGVGCVECHGQVNQMDEKGVYQFSPLNMAWCIECHRDPTPHLRPRNEVTNMTWKPEDVGKDLPGQTVETYQAYLKKQYHVNANTDCVTCHR